MSIEQRIADAFVDFDALIVDGRELDAAIAEAAKSNDLPTEVLKNRLLRSGSLEQRVGAIRHSAERARFTTILDREIARSKNVNPFTRREAVLLALENVFQRPLTEHEIWLVEERISPWISEWKLARAASAEPLRKLSLDE